LQDNIGGLKLQLQSIHSLSVQWQQHSDVTGSILQQLFLKWTLQPYL
jgi:hypothetical protein